MVITTTFPRAFGPFMKARRNIIHPQGSVSVLDFEFGLTLFTFTSFCPPRQHEQRKLLSLLVTLMVCWDHLCEKLLLPLFHAGISEVKFSVLWLWIADMFCVCTYMFVFHLTLAFCVTFDVSTLVLCDVWWVGSFECSSLRLRNIFVKIFKEFSVWSSVLSRWTISYLTSIQKWVGNFLNRNKIPSHRF